MKRYWTCEVSYDGKTPFHFFSTEMYIETETELEAEKLLSEIVSECWAKISPHPAPRLLSVIPLRVILVRN